MDWLSYPDILHTEPFVPHPWEEIAAKRVFPREVNERWYRLQCDRFTDAAETMEVARITYRSDGLRVTGIAARPRGATQKLPLVLFHRGGQGDYGMLTATNLVFPIAGLVQAGYWVLASNYRGNDGGEGQDAFGGAEVADILNLEALSRALPMHNGEAPYQLGWSRGGMMAYLATRHGLRTRATATMAAISTMHDAGETRTTTRTRLQESWNGQGEHPLDARSAQCWPEALASSPLLMLHGNADKAVDVSHSQQLAARLTAISAPHRYVEYEAGTHSFSQYQTAAMQEILAWFAAHR